MSCQPRVNNACDALEHINRLTEGSELLLDFGCFCGVFLSAAAQAGWDCYGIEPLVAPAIYTRATFDIPVITDTLRDNTYPPDSFDVLTAFQAFEHLIRPDQEIEMIHRILKPRGVMVIEVPNIDTLAVKIMGGANIAISPKTTSPFFPPTPCRFSLNGLIFGFWRSITHRE